jgi:hypothetical protein
VFGDLALLICRKLTYAGQFAELIEITSGEQDASRYCACWADGSDSDTFFIRTPTQTEQNEPFASAK